MMPRFLRLLATLVCTAVLATPAHAAPVARDHTTVELVAESPTVAPGKPVTLALRLTPAAGWHTYWKNPGDSGLETSLDWTLPSGFTAGELAYPTPARIPFGELVNFGYAGDTTLLVTLTPPATLAPGAALPLKAKASWLVCDDQQCVPEDAELALTLTAGDGAADPAQAALFAAARAAMPLAVDWPARFRINGDRFTLAVPLGVPARGIEQVYFFPLDDGALSYADMQDVVVDQDKLWLTTKAGYKTTLDRLSGVLTIKLAGAPKANAYLLVASRDEEQATAIPAGAQALGKGNGGNGGNNDNGAPTPGRGGTLLLAALGGAVLGGLLLNLMPCVFPILSLKALSLARAGESDAHARIEALAYTAGVLATMAGLGGLLLVLRAGGDAVGWAFHLQDPRVVAVLALLMTAIGFNLAGLFEVNLGIAGSGQSLAGQGGVLGAFWTGALAVLVATPCTAPFMAASLGATLTLPAGLALLVYLSLGLGMALPFLAIGFLPALRRRLPRPGAWMDGFRRLLAFPMFATALWLFWVMGQQVGVDGMTLTLAVALLLALLLWSVGRAQAAHRPTRWRWVATALVIALASGAALPRITPLSAEAGTPALAAADKPLGATPYSEARLAALLAAGTPTFVYFTADWCVTCKVNEKVALSRDEVAQAFAKAGVVTLEGDWTRRDAEIAATLKRYGRDGVPLYLYFAPRGDKSAPRVLPQVLTPQTLIDTVRT